MTTQETLRHDPMFDADTAVPLSSPFLDDASPDLTPLRAGRPFGMRFAVPPPHPVVVDLSRVRFDPDRQVCVDGDGTPIFGRHTDGTTNTQTSDGHKNMDSDTDHRED
ncbi:putative ATP-grasp-modified RiPP [Pseudonocardia endophytica]|uniref:Putative ATP-grasp target RiPP n=1 Tax=Pseudonocardia endophytica TaxID=401976 RepID=A0A4R1HU35_PSEEN|nr:putative ATP-grasp-modified RiPP [Pseudonocardia endophytica]TCK20942.1 putative ATP-grasp target RiPP [Pseudonocardia endophytica]